MPQSWWNLPTDNEFLKMCNAEVTMEMDRMLGQLWHFQIETLVHLPFMLRSATDRRYDYSKICCLNACRELIQRWLLLRKCEEQPFICYIVDFQAFMSAIIILLGLMGPASQGILDPRQRDQDRRMVDELVQRIERTVVAYRYELGTQCAAVLKTLISTDLNGLAGNLHLKIPYFGVLTLVSGAQAANLDRRTPSTTPASFPNDFCKPALETTPVWPEAPSIEQNMMPPPVLSFASTQFPGLEDLDIDLSAQWQFRDSDIRVFDSLLNTDVEGNWGFGTL
jgi:hypothetical protein